MTYLSLHFQRSLLNNAIRDLETSHAILKEQFEELHPKIRGNPMVLFRQRMACQAAFEKGADLHFERIVKKLRDNSTLVARALALWQPQVARFALGLADANMDEAETYIWGLNGCVHAHLQVEGWFIWKGLLDLDEEEAEEEEDPAAGVHAGAAGTA